MKKNLLTLCVVLLCAVIGLKAESGSPRIIGNPPKIVIDSGGEPTMPAGGIWKVYFSVEMNSFNGITRNYGASKGKCVHQIDQKTKKEILSWDTTGYPAGKYSVTFTARNEYGAQTYTWDITLTEEESHQ